MNRHLTIDVRALPCRRISCYVISSSIQLKYTIEGVSKILAPPREIGLVKGNQNLANFRNGIL